MKNPWVLVGIIAVLLFGGAVWFSNSSNTKNNEGVTITSHTKGGESATVTLIEYSDFQCPACAAFYPVVAEVLSAHGDAIHFEYKHFPLPMHPYAQQAAVAAEAAGQQGKFFEFHDKLFENQSVWSNSATPNTHFVNYAEELGLDVELFKKHLNASLLKEQVRAQMQEGRERNVTGTPTFFLNGEKMEFDTYQAFIEQVASAVDPNTSFGASDAVEGGVNFGL